jgi:uncharacterized protein
MGKFSRPTAALRRLFSSQGLVIARTLALGAGGGALLAWLQMPLAWMIGAMLVSTGAALSRLGVHVPATLRNVMIVVLGILLGSSFQPEILNQIPRWSISLGGLVLYTLVCLAAGIWLLRRSGFDRVTAFFTAAPGGFNEMVLIGGSKGGDVRTIALCHSIRVMLVVFTIPVWFQLLVGYDPAARGPLGPPLAAIPPVDYLLLAACAVGAPLAAWARFPAAFLTGPMLLSAAIHLAGLTATKPPGIMIAAAQVVIGCYIGCRFAGADIRQIGRTLLIGALLTAVLLAITVLFAFVLGRLSGIGVIDLVLAYAPGGLAEMSLVALALDVNAAFVASHHVVRILLILLFAPLLFAFITRRSGGTPG